MPPKSRKRVDEYEDDDGFVEDAPKSKRSKTASKSATSKELQHDDDGNPFWEVSHGEALFCLRHDLQMSQLSGKRRVQISEFKGMQMVS